MKIAELFVDVLPDMGGFTSDLNRTLAQAARSAHVTVPIEADTKQFGKKVSADSAKIGKDAGKKFGGGFSGAMKGAIGVAGALGIASAATGLIKGAMSEARDAQKTAAQTNAVIKSTGGIAKVTAKDVDSLASSISAKTGIDDEQIAASENMLLTFTNVRNEAGKGNKIFSEATKVVTDMAAATGGDATKSSVMLGKALNDPTKGISALSRVGVTFTEQQKKQIKAMQDQGNMAGAQKVILGELKKEFGGSAEAQATAADKAKVAWGNFQETLGTAVMPVVDRLLNLITNKVLPALLQFGTYFKEKLLPPIMEVAGWLRDHLMPVFTAMAGFFMDHIAEIGLFAKVLAVIAGAVGLATLAVAAFNAVLAINPITLIVIGLAALVTAVILAYRHFETFRNIVNTAWAVIKTVISVAWNSVIKPIFTALVNFVRNTLIPILQYLWANVVKPVFAAIGRAIAFMWNNVVKPIFSAYKAYLTNVLIPVIKFLFNNVVKPIFSAIGKIIGFVWSNVIKPAFSALRTYLTNVVFPIIRFLYNNVVKPIFEAVGRAIKGVWDSVIKPTFNAIKTGVSAVKTGFKTAVDGIVKIWDGLKKAAAVPANFVIDTIWNNGLRKALNLIPGVDIAEADKIPGYAKGGVLPGYTPGRDVHQFYSPTGGRLALSGGEGIMRPEWVKKVGGAAAVARMNLAARRGGRPTEMAKGGIVTVNGEPMSRVAAAQLLVANRASNMGMRVIQGSYQPYTSYSKGSHMGGGVMDTSPGNFSAQSWLRKVAFAAWGRNFPGAASAGSGAHVHSVSTIDPESRGNGQVAAFKRGEDGLGGRDYGPNPKPRADLLDEVKRIVGSDLDLSGAGGGGGTDWLGLIKKLPGLITGVIDDIKSMGDSGFPKLMKDAAKNVLNKAIDWVNDKIPNFLLPDNPIPRFAKGGIVTQPTIGLIGEAGPEAILPMSRGGVLGFKKGGVVSAAVKKRRAADTATVKDFANGIKRGMDASTIAKRLDPVIKRYLSGKAEKSRLVQSKHLQSLANSFKSVTGKLSTATAKRTGLVAQRDALSGAFGGLTADVTQFGSSQGGIKAGLAGQLAATKKFAGNLRALKKAGFPLGLIQQVAGAGVVSGNAMAAQLLGLSAADKKSVGGNFTAINSFAASTGKALGNEFFGGAIRAADGVIAGLKKKQDAIGKQFETLGKSIGVGLTKQLQKSLPGLAPKKKSSGGGGKSGGGKSGGGKSGGGKSGGGGGNSPKDIARRALAAYGWSGQWSALNNIVNHESSWRPTARNPSSGAYGLFQFLDSTWASTGIKKTSNPSRQITAGLRYIKKRYGSPNKAWSFWQKHHWYDSGGWLQQGRTMAVNNTGKPEAVYTHDQWQRIDRLIAAVEAGQGRRSGAPFIGHAVIRETVDLERYERQRAFRERRATV